MRRAGLADIKEPGERPPCLLGHPAGFVAAVREALTVSVALAEQVQLSKA
jgi:hypothetical protein